METENTPANLAQGERPFPAHSYPEDVAILQVGDKTVLLIGTAHISQESADLVQTVIEQEHPDAVCLELDEKRYASLSKRQRWENTDLREIVRKRQLATLMVNLILASYQKKLGLQMGIMPGTELLAAAQTAQLHGIKVSLCDRDVRVTLRRSWHATSLWQKGELLAAMLNALFFDKTEIDEAKLAELRQKDILSELIDELGATLPQIKKTLIDERDIYMAEKIKATPGKRLVAVVGAGHRAGIERVIKENHAAEMDAISLVPPVAPWVKLLGWLIPVVIILSLVLIGLRQGMGELSANALYWILANGIPAAFGGILALGHPVTIVTAFAAAPFTSLTPLIGVGYVCAFVQIMLCPPLVREFENVSKDIGTFKGWWNNKLLRIFLVFLLTSFGSAAGTFLGGYRIFSTLLGA